MSKNVAELPGNVLDISQKELSSPDVSREFLGVSWKLLDMSPNVSGNSPELSQKIAESSRRFPDMS